MDSAPLGKVLSSVGSAFRELVIVANLVPLRPLDGETRFLDTSCVWRDDSVCPSRDVAMSKQPAPDFG